MSERIDSLDRIPSRYHYMINLLDTLRAFGGAATSQQVYEWFRIRGIARSSDLAVQPSKETRFVKEVRFARLMLFYGGLIAENEPGRWELTPEGWNTELDLEDARMLARRSGWECPGHHSLALGSAPAESEPSLGGPTRGPSPTAWRGIVERESSGPASTYAMRFGRTRIWKIGYASNITRRLAEVNRHIPVEVMEDRWTLALERQCPTVRDAYDMEQSILQLLTEFRTTGQRVHCTGEALISAWSKATLSETSPVPVLLDGGEAANLGDAKVRWIDRNMAGEV